MYGLGIDSMIARSVQIIKDVRVTEDCHGRTLKCKVPQLSHKVFHEQ